MTLSNDAKEYIYNKLSDKNNKIKWSIKITYEFEIDEGDSTQTGYGDVGSTSKYTREFHPQKETFKEYKDGIIMDLMLATANKIIK